MNRGRILFVALVAATAAIATSVSPTHASTVQGIALSGNAAQIQQLQAQRAALVTQLDALLPGQQGAAVVLGSAESTYWGAQSKLDAAQHALDVTNAKLAQLAQGIQADQTAIAGAKVELGKAARGAYESTQTTAVVSQVLDSKSISSAVQKIQGASTVNQQLNQLQFTLSSREDSLRNQQQQLNNANKAATAEANALASQSNAFLAVVADRNLAYTAASGPVRTLEAEIANIDNEIAALESPAGPVNGGSPCGNRFSFGQCTWYVATRRCIPWIGNADQWYYNAAKMGYQEGHQPQVGAVVVFWPGGDGASSVGHVGYVEAVGPSDGIPAGEFKLSEMNYAGWDRVSYRVLPNGSAGIQGFIYGHS